MNFFFLNYKIFENKIIHDFFKNSLNPFFLQNKSNKKDKHIDSLRRFGCEICKIWWFRQIVRCIEKFLTRLARLYLWLNNQFSPVFINNVLIQLFSSVCLNKEISIEDSILIFLK